MIPEEQEEVEAQGEGERQGERQGAGEGEGEGEETEEQASLRRKQEEQAAIEALEAYFAYRSAAAAAVAVAEKQTFQVKQAGDKAPASINSNATEMSRPHIQGQNRTTIGRRASSPTLCPSSYFERYANDPLSSYIPNSSSSKYGAPSPIDSIYTNIRRTAPHQNQEGSKRAEACQESLTSRPRLRMRKSETHLRNTSVSKNEGYTGGYRRRPSLIPNTSISIQVRPRGYTYSCSPSTSSGINGNEKRHDTEHHRQQNGSYTSETSTASSSNFLNFGNSPDSPTFGTHLQHNMLKKGLILPSPPRSSSLARDKAWPSNSPSASMLDLDSVTPSPTRVTFVKDFSGTANTTFARSLNNALDAYRFPDRSPNTISCSPAFIPSPGSMAGSGSVKMHSTPLGSATASRRGSLIASQHTAGLRSRAGSVAASVISSSNESLTNKRNAMYEYI